MFTILAVEINEWFCFRLIYDRYGQTVGLVKKLGPQEFDLPQNVIDIIYSQTLCW